MKDLKRIFQCLLPYRKPFILAVLFVVVETSFELIIPMIMAVSLMWELRLQIFIILWTRR